MKGPTITKEFNAGMLKILKGVCTTAWEAADFGLKTADDTEEEEKHIEAIDRARGWHTNLGLWEKELEAASVRYIDIDKAKEVFADKILREAGKIGVNTREAHALFGVFMREGLVGASKMLNDLRKERADEQAKKQSEVGGQEGTTEEV